MGSLGCLAGPSGRTLSHCRHRTAWPRLPGAPLTPETLGFPLGQAGSPRGLKTCWPLQAHLQGMFRGRHPGMDVFWRIQRSPVGAVSSTGCTMGHQHWGCHGTAWGWPIPSRQLQPCCFHPARFITQRAINALKLSIYALLGETPRPGWAGQRNWAREARWVTVSVCPLPSGPEPEDSSKTGSGPPEAETQLCHPARTGGRGGDGGVGLDAHDSAVRRELCPGFSSSPSSSLPKSCGSKSLTFSLCSSTALWDEESEHPSTSHCWARTSHISARWRLRLCWGLGDPLAVGVQLELVGMGSLGQPWQFFRLWWDAATWLPAVSLLRLLPEPPAKPEGTGSDRGEEISWALSRGAVLVHWGLCHHLGPQIVPGDPSERMWPVRRCKPGWERAGWPPFPPRPRESLTAA